MRNPFMAALFTESCMEAHFKTLPGSANFSSIHKVGLCCSHCGPAARLLFLALLINLG